MIKFEDFKIRILDKTQLDYIDIVKDQGGYTKSKSKSLLFCGKLRKLVENQKVKPRQGRQIHKSVIALLLKHSKITPYHTKLIPKL